MTCCECCNEHNCQPDRWPVSIPDSWTCPECGQVWRAFDPDPAFAKRSRIPEGKIVWKLEAVRP